MTRRGSFAILPLVGMVLAVWMAFSSAVFADGVIIPIPPPDIPIHEVPMLAVKYHRVTVRIADQVAVTQIDQVFLNESSFQLEGTYVFPLPEDAAVSEFAMYVDGQRLEGEMLDRDKARQIYEDIVRRRRDPALLEYIGRGAFRARIFPIEPHGEKRVQLEYSQVLPMEGGLVRYTYPLNTERFSSRPIEDVSIHVEIESKEAIKAVYSPSHDLAVDRDGDYRASAGFEERDVRPDKDFSLYYTVSGQDIGANLISYKPRGEDGFFLLLVAPNIEAEDQAVVAKDVVVVLDTSGSMRGEKLAQAKDALEFILESLNPDDRFNVIAFSTGTNPYADALQPASDRAGALDFVHDLRAVGGTNIERALSEALRQASGERPQVVIFLTDGLATEGVTETDRIIDRVTQSASPETRLFAFGIGDEVNTILLDTIAQGHRGTTAYVRPGQDIEAEVSTFYAKISTPVLADLDLDWGALRVRDEYPDPLPDLFAGSQLVLVGRYRDGGTGSLTIKGEVNGEQQRFTYDDLILRESGGDSFIARLWATRRVGYLLGQIRLHGEDQELVEEIVDLAVLYGIMTPYTSFLIQEDDILSPQARSEVAQEAYGMMAAPTAAAGAAAVDRSVDEESLRKAEMAPASTSGEIKTVGEKTFLLRNGVWTDTSFDSSSMKPLPLVFGSDEYFDLLAAHTDWGPYFSVGRQVIVVLDGTAYQVSES